MSTAAELRITLEANICLPDSSPTAIYVDSIMFEDGCFEYTAQSFGNEADETSVEGSVLSSLQPDCMVSTYSMEDGDETDFEPVTSNVFKALSQSTPESVIVSAEDEDVLPDFLEDVDIELSYGSDTKSWHLDRIRLEY